MAWNELMCWSTWALVTPLRSDTSFMVETNSDTRDTSVLSIALMFSCAPLSTSWRRMLASRRRSNSVVVSERSMLCVSTISLRLEEVDCFDFSIALVVVSCSSLSVRETVVVAVWLASLTRRAICSLLSIRVRVKVKPWRFDRLHRVVGRLRSPRC